MIDLQPAAPKPEPPAQSEPTGEATATPAATPSWLKRHWKWLSLVCALVLGGGGVYAWTVLRPAPQPTDTHVTKRTPKPTPTPTPLLKASPLTGVMVEPALADRPIVSVVVENHPDARPQSGLAEAGVVYEALAEGGITRFQAFFLDSQPAKIGPVRSLRPYFVDWGLEYAAPIAHAGGSAEALGSIGPLGVKSLNALVIGAPSFYRASDRRAPHNLYTSAALLDALLAKRGYHKPAGFTPTPRKADTPSAAPAHPTIGINYSYNGFQAGYTYEAASNSYVRSLAGKPHLDRATGQPIKVKNVVVIYTSVTVGDSKGHMKIQTTGQGRGILFRDGEAIAVTWSKDARTSRTKLLDAAGAEVPLNAGNTWYSIVPTGKAVSY
jgi:hypothetical protein